MSHYARVFGTRQQQLDALRKQGWQILQLKKLPVVIAYYQKAVPKDAVYVKGWVGNADKHSFYWHCRSMDLAETNVRHWLNRVSCSEQVKSARLEERRAKRSSLKASDHWSVGDALYNSWGYEQTNVDWYQVVEVKAKSIVIRAIKKNYGEKGFLSGYCQPRRNDFRGEPLAKPLSPDGRISMRHGAATKWDGRPVYESHYH